MRRNFIIIGIVAVVAVGLIWWLRGRSDDHAAKSTAGHKSSAGKRVAGPRVPAKPATVSGHVTRKADGGAIAGAVVSLAWAELGADFSSVKKPTIVVTTDPSGAWIAKDVPPGDYMIAATAKGLLPSARDKLVVASGETRTAIDFALEAGGTPVRGTVSDMLGGPIASARVTAGHDSWSFTRDAEFVALTGADGTYELTLPDGEYKLAAAHDDYTKDTEEAEVAGKPLTVDFKLIPGGTIRGSVVARDTGKPVGGALVSVSLGGRFSGAKHSAVADDTGQFAVRGLSSGNASLTARGRGYASSQPTSVQLGIGEEVDGIVVLVDGAFSISGRVVKKGTKQGIAGAKLGAFSMGGGEQGEALDPSDADGNFVIDGMRPGNYMLFAGAENQMLEIGKNVEVVDRDVTDVIIEMSAGVTLSGRVDPGAVATVSLELETEPTLMNMFDMVKAAMCRGQSDAAGAFTLHNAPPGTFKLSAHTKDGRKGKLGVTVAATDQSGLVVPITPRASIAGRVIDTNGKPVAGVEVVARSEDEKRRTISFGGMMRDEASSASDGSFKIVGLDAGKYDVRARTRGDWSAEIRKEDRDKKKTIVEVAEGQEKTGVTVTVEAKDGVIRGVVIGADHKPAADAWVTARGDHDLKMKLPEGMDDDFDWMPSSEPVLTNDAGQFTITKLKKGKYTLIAEGPRGNSRGEKKGVNTGDSATIQLASLGTLAVTVTQATKPVTKYDLSCSGKTSIERHVEAADGRYSLDHLAPGDYKCTVHADAGTADGKVTVPAGEAKLALAIAPWGSLTGVVVSVLDGKPVPGLAVVASSGDMGRGMVEVMSGGGTKTDANGRFVVEKVGAGKGRLMLVPKDTSLMNMDSHDYVAKEGQRVDMGTIKVVPPRTGEAGTFGLTTEMPFMQPDAGVNVDSLTVTNVKEGGPAAAAGVQVGDKITTIDGKPIKQLTPQIAHKLLESGTASVGQTVKLTLERGQTVVLVATKW